jgi:hypothetical protein
MFVPAIIYPDNGQDGTRQGVALPWPIQFKATTGKLVAFMADGNLVEYIGRVELVDFDFTDGSLGLWKSVAEWAERVANPIEMPDLEF